jgi:hypothetical protein
MHVSQEQSQLTKKLSLISLSPSIKPTAEGNNLAGVMDGGYKLRSRGPASQGCDVLDNLVSRVR